MNKIVIHLYRLAAKCEINVPYCAEHTYSRTDANSIAPGAHNFNPVNDMKWRRNNNTLGFAAVSTRSLDVVIR